MTDRLLLEATFGAMDHNSERWGDLDPAEQDRLVERELQDAAAAVRRRHPDDSGRASELVRKPSCLIVEITRTEGPVEDVYVPADQVEQFLADFARSYWNGAIRRLTIQVPEVLGIPKTDGRSE